MTFLTPIPALVAAAITVPLLLALYLLKLRRRPLRVASTLFWPRASEDAQVNVPLRWLRPSWLLLLHLLALLCLLVAFARPAVEDGEGVAGRRVVLLIDASASMGAIDGNGGESSNASAQPETRLDRARERARKLVRELRAGDGRDIAVVSFAATAQPLSGFTSSRSMLDAAIESAAQTDQPADLPAALTFVESLLASGAEGDAPEADGATVILLSDGSFAPADEPLESTLRLRFDRIGPEFAAADAPARIPRADNLGIVGFAARRDDANPSIVRVFARLANANPVALDVPLTLAIEGQPAARRAVRVDGAASQPARPSADASDTDAPGQAQVLLEVPTAPRGVLTLTIDRPDALASDNVASLVLPDIFQPDIVVVSSPPQDPAQPASGTITQGFDWLVTDVLEELSARPARVITPEAFASQTSDAEPPDLIVFLSNASTGAPAANAGTSRASVRTPSLSFATSADLGAVTFDPDAPTLAPRAGSIFWERTHPLMAGVPLDNLIVRKTAAWRIPAREPGAVDARTTVLARADDTPLIVLVERAGVEHVLVGFDLVDTNWPLQPSFAVFLANVVDRLTPRARSFVGQSFSTSQPVRVRAQSAGRVTLEGPVSLTLRESGMAAAPPNSPGPQTLDAGLLPRAGLYIVRGAGADGDRAVAVNLSDLTETATLAPAEVRVGARPVAQFERSLVPRELWSWFVLAAAALLAIEWFVYGWQVRK